MEHFTGDFCDFLPKNVKIWLLDNRLSNRHEIQAFQGFLISKDPKSELVRQHVRHFVHSLSGDNNLVPFHFW